VKPSLIEDLNFAMKSVPSVNTLASVTAPSTLSIDSFKMFEVIKDRRLGNKFRQIISVQFAPSTRNDSIKA